MREQLARMVPEARIMVAHGQMKERQLEDRIHAFLRREAERSQRQYRQAARATGARHFHPEVRYTLIDDHVPLLDAGLLERVPGRRLPDEREERPPRVVFDRLSELVATLHAAARAIRCTRAPW